MNKQIVHDALILTAFTLVLGLILGIVYGVTKPRIDAEKQKASEAAYQQVFADASSFEAYEFNSDEATAYVQEAGYNDVINDIQKALAPDGNVIGYVITVTAKDGSQGSITFSVGITNEGLVNGYSITEISETPGLGMKAQDEEFYSQFQNKLVNLFTVVKQKPSAESEIEAITGSTITSKAMANGCNAALVYFRSFLQEVSSNE